MSSNWPSSNFAPFGLKDVEPAVRNAAHGVFDVVAADGDVEPAVAVHVAEAGLAVVGQFVVDAHLVRYIDGTFPCAVSSEIGCCRAIRCLLPVDARLIGECRVTKRSRKTVAVEVRQIGHLSLVRSPVQCQFSIADG